MWGIIFFAAFCFGIYKLKEHFAEQAERKRAEERRRRAEEEAHKKREKEEARRRQLQDNLMMAQQELESERNCSPVTYNTFNVNTSGLSQSGCPNCGAAVDNDGKFCKYCGAKLNRTIEIEQSFTHRDEARIKEAEAKVEIAKAMIKEQQEHEERERQIAKEQSRKGALFVIIIILLLLFGPMLVFKIPSLF